MDRQTQKQTRGKAGKLEDKIGSQQKKGKENKIAVRNREQETGDRLRQNGKERIRGESEREKGTAIKT